MAAYINAHLIANQITKVPHPAFLRDLTPSYFYVSAKLKAVPKRSLLEYEIELLCDVMRL
jgi:hypothetical protein